MIYKLLLPFITLVNNKSMSEKDVPIRATKKAKHNRLNFWIGLVIHETSRDQRIKNFGKDPLF